MAGASEEAVRSSLRRILPTVDMDVTTERQIRDTLAKQLGTSMDPFKKLIKDEIDTFLTSSADGAVAPEEDVDPPSSLEPVGSRKRGPAAAAAGEKPSKVARGSSEGPQGVQLDNKGTKWLSVSNFKGQQRVDIRIYFTASGGSLAPTKKGISLDCAEWSALQGVFEGVAQALADGDEAYCAQLPNNIRVTTSTFNGRVVVGVRQYYEAGGELRPGQKGINLTPDEWGTLVEAAHGITDQLGQAPTPAAAAAATAAGGAAGGGGSNKGGGSKAGRGATTAAAGGGGGGGGAAAVELGGKKRATISTFTGTKCVDLREFYDKDGELRPGKKGISLKPDQWRQLSDAAEAITSALSAHNTRYCLELGNKRRVAISEFKGVWYVGVREYYESGGELKPGAKGLSMNREQWQKLIAAMNSLSAALD